MADPLIFNIQKFSIHDGEGIRTTVFFKGCPLRCAWCHNPESQSFEAEGWACKTYDVNELCALLERDRIFYDGSGGGVTLSGGEPLAQDQAYVLALAERLCQRGIRVAIDTCGHAPYAHFQALLPYIDTFLYDIKLINDDLHQRYTGVSNGLILENARRLSEDSARINLRVPVIPGMNMGNEEMGRIIAFVQQNMDPQQINLMPYHRLGQDKNARLGRENRLLDEPTPEEMQAICDAWREVGFESVYIGG
ncbi:MAG: glycyl-radical enzyme activating protein [Clostridia bacterium]|nr:glycyl-radical enzyme activating protein [Clostridia bacterium]